MTDLILIKTTDDGIEILMDPADGRFQATFGCDCSKKHLEDWGTHSHNCAQRTLSRKSLADLERAIGTAGHPQELPRVKVISVGSHEPEVLEIGDVLSVRRTLRYRYPSGAMMREYTDCRVFDQAAFDRLHAAWEAYQAASSRYHDLVRDHGLLPKITTRDELRALVKRQAEEQDGA